ncbi:helix-turn-helix domain-containing protein [Nitratireductor aquibiodomus RA22]|uniref:Helix-turn-helix domain-containing protein n=2 Tax=Nitratireductor aquibiodomus TaxID=204799 RepID=I5C5B0_9HYPH|nr:helix-turn-helix domain-containing protein [Nitratireductor aquibiodomus RA22]
MIALDVCMNLIEPHRFTPAEAGTTATVTLPSLPRKTHVDVRRITAGLVLACSHFSKDMRQDDIIRRPAGDLLLTFNLSGRMQLVGHNGTAHEIGGGQAWIIRTGGKPLQRIVEKGEGCSNIVIALAMSRLDPALSDQFEKALPATRPLRRLRLPVPGRAELDMLLDERCDPAALLRKEGQCLALVGHALEELSACPGSSVVADHRTLLVSRITALLSERMADTITMPELERVAGMSHVTLNHVFRAETGMTVFERLRMLRIETAEQMIRHTDRSFTDIAATCGFADASHLSNAFRKRFGVTASEWRRRGNKNG